MGESAAKTQFLDMLDDSQLVVYLTHAGKPTCNEAMANILTFRQYTVYEAVQKEIEIQRLPSNVDSFRSLEVQENRRDTTSTIATGQFIQMNGLDICTKRLKENMLSPLSDDSIDYKDFENCEVTPTSPDADDTVSEGSDMTEVAEAAFPEPYRTSDQTFENRTSNFVALKTDDAPTGDSLYVHPRVLSAVNSVRQQLDELTNQARRMLRFLENTQELARMSGSEIDIFDMNTQLPSELESQISVSDLIKECGFCKADHESNNCKKYPTLEDRLNCLTQCSCMRCLRCCGKTCDDVFCIYCDSSEHNVAICPSFEHRQFLKLLLAEGEGSSSSGSVSILRF